MSEISVCFKRGQCIQFGSKHTTKSKRGILFYHSTPEKLRAQNPDIYSSVVPIPRNALLHKTALPHSIIIVQYVEVVDRGLDLSMATRDHLLLVPHNQPWQAGSICELGDGVDEVGGVRYTVI